MIQKNIHNTDKIKLIDHIPLQQPLCISIEPSNLCNFKCSMCYHGNNENDAAAKPLKNMTWDIFQKTVDDVKKLVMKTGNPIKLIKLYSTGEPLLNKKIVDMIKTIKNLNICEKIEVTTNASLMDEKIARDLVDSGLDILRISVYSIYSERMKIITKSEISPDVIKKNVQYIWNYRNGKGANLPIIYVKMLDSNTKENDDFIEEYCNCSDEVGIDEVFELNIGDGNSAFDNFYGDLSKEAHEKSMSMNTYGSEKRRPCRYPFTHLTIRNDGTAIVCCADWLKELKIGNINNNTIEEIWNSKTLYQLRIEMIKTKATKWVACRHCEIPYRDSEYDDVSKVDVNKLSYRYEI